MGGITTPLGATPKPKTPGKQGLADIDPFTGGGAPTGAPSLPSLPKFPSLGTSSGGHTRDDIGVVRQPPVGPGGVATAGGGGVAPGGGPVGAPGPGGVVTATNTAQMSPALQQQMQRYADRFSADNTKRAIDNATLGTMDAAALAAKDLKGNMASRGVLGSGTGASFLQKRVFAPAQRQAAGQASDIALAQQNRLDALTLGGTGLMTAPDQINLANRGLGIQQWEAQAADARARAQMEQQARDAQLSQYLALAQMSQALAR